MPPRHDVEGEIYGRLYGAAGKHGDAPRRVLGRHDPALVAPVHEDRGEPPPGRLQYAANAVRARARTWLATGAVSETAAQRRGGVVAPAPSVARALALVAVGIALVAVAALGAFIPDRATERPRAGGPSPSERAAAGPPPAARLAEADRRERAQSRRARRERQARRERAHAAGRSPAHAGSGGASAQGMSNGGVASRSGRVLTASEAGCSGGCVPAFRAPSTGSGSGNVVATGPGDTVVIQSAPAGSLGGGSSAGGIVVGASP